MLALNMAGGTWVQSVALVPRAPDRTSYLVWAPLGPCEEAMGP